MHRRNEEIREPWNYFFEVAVDNDDDDDDDDDDSARVSPPPVLDVKDSDDLDTNASMLHLVHTNRGNAMMVVWILGGHLLGDATEEQVEKSVIIHQGLKAPNGISTTYYQCDRTPSIPPNSPTNSILRDHSAVGNSIGADTPIVCRCRLTDNAGNASRSN